MEATGVVLISLLAVVVSGLLARALRLPLPLVQIALGGALHYTSLSAVTLAPEVFFLLFLPPLLFLDGWRMPKDALRRDAATILQLALGLVVFTVLGVGLFIHWLIPTMPLAVAFALAAVISPTDPIAVSAIAGSSHIPRRLMHILEGESLLNDASGLVCMRFAVAAVLTGTFSMSAALVEFLWVALGGLAVGFAVTWLVARAAAWASLRHGEDGGAQILVTLLVPFGVYLLAEQLACSGILAAVAAGITMSYTDIWQWRAGTRLRRTAVWDIVQLAANGSIFVLLGAQIPALLAAAPQTVLATGHTSAWWLALYVGVIVVVLGGLRFGWVWVSLQMAFIDARRRGAAPPAAGWRLVLVTSLAGVRGAVTLAGVLSLPAALADGSPFPARDLAILLAAGVIVLSLVLATVGLPRTLQGLELPPEPSRQAAEARARTAAAGAAIAAIDAAQQRMGAGLANGYRHTDTAARIMALYQQRIERDGLDVDASQQRDDADLERQLRRIGLHAEREELLRSGRAHGLNDLDLRKMMRELDLQETRYGG
jgi:Na+/H+ antiporter